MTKLILLNTLFFVLTSIAIDFNDDNNLHNLNLIKISSNQKQCFDQKILNFFNQYHLIQLLSNN
ncbi:hypothetical protein MCAV_02660 [[Mycoplasma] cavipharyngis]